MQHPTQTGDRNQTVAQLDPEGVVPAAPAETMPCDPDRDEPECGPLERTDTLCDLGRYGEAVAMAGQAITEDPRDPRAWCLMARAQIGDEHPARALEAARAAAKLHPESELPLRLASLALSALGREEEAIDAALDATQREPESWQAQARLARALAVIRHRLKEARAAAARAQALEPFDPEPHLAAGAVALASGKPSDATSAFCAALSLDPLCGEAHNQLADIQSEVRPSLSQRLREAPRPARLRLPRLGLARRRPHWG
jgi:tetratricopeptide (TPR) repeat protein